MKLINKRRLQDRKRRHLHEMSNNTNTNKKSPSFFWSKLGSNFINKTKTQIESNKMSEQTRTKSIPITKSENDHNESGNSSLETLSQHESSVDEEEIMSNKNIFISSFIYYLKF